MNLSGGQKQRVSIARAVYAQADVFLFDDPLSALDAYVSQHVFELCISNKGLLKDKLRILITNQVHVLPICDNVFFLNEGTVMYQGSFDDLSKSNEAFNQSVSEQKTLQRNISTRMTRMKAFLLLLSNSNKNNRRITWTKTRVGIMMMVMMMPLRIPTSSKPD